MEKKEIRGALKHYTARFLYAVLFVIVSVLVTIFLRGDFGELSVYEQKDICLDDGGVWDGREMRCRRDCLAWNEVDGCIPLEKSE